MKGLANSLAVARSPIPDDEFVIQLFNSLPLEFDTIVANVTSCDVIEIDEL